MNKTKEPKKKKYHKAGKDCKIFVKNIPKDTSDEYLEAFFSKFGSI